MSIKKHKSVTAFLCFLACSVNPFTSLAVAQDAVLEHTIEVLEKVIQKEIDRGLASASVALVKGDQIIWTGAYGYANVGMKAPATTETLYTTASTLKPVTATAILTLVEQGKIKLEDPVNKYLGEHAVADKPSNSVTVRSLLDHTSGLSDDEGQASSSVRDRYRPKILTLEEVAVDMKSEVPVGERWRYNNSAYALAGLIVEKVSGVPYETYIMENILSPVGATTPHPINPTPEMTEMIANPYTSNTEGQRISMHQGVASVYPAGIAYMKAEDMARFLGAHINGGRFNENRILSRDFVEMAHQSNMEDYGLGWWTPKDGSGKNLIMHGGMGVGFATTMIGDVDAGIGAYVMTNTSSQACYRIADAAMKLMAGEEYSLEDRVAVSVDPARLKRLWGEYDQKNGFRYKLTSDGEKLMVEIFYGVASGNTMVYLPASETSFFNSAFGIEIEFQESATGGIKGFSMLQHSWLDYGFAERMEK